ncbi:MAG: sigma-70 family RNA polymerase sigma factor [Verrucomicrobiota bacterium]
MAEVASNSTDNAATAKAFATTRWTLILTAQDGSSASQAALETLCQTYWFPVYALVRKCGCDPEAAGDFTQEFFARLLSGDRLAAVRRERGRFRAFLAQSVKNFLADEWDKSRAQKRGGGQVVLSLDAEIAEGRYLDVPHDVTPDKLFDRQWAEQLLAAARARLHAEFQAAGQKKLLDVLEQIGDPDAAPLASEAGCLGMPLNTLKSHLHRARLRQAEIIRELVADTVSTPKEVENELRDLLEALRT